MYKETFSKNEIYFWAHKSVAIPLGKRPSAEVTGTTSTKRRKNSGSEYVEEKMSEVEECVKKLKDKHGSDFTPEQYRTWAHLINMEKHASYETPPDKPFFRRSSKGKQLLSSSNSSPGKKISLRSQCIDQLSKWHHLLESGIISQSEYDELQKKIMADIKEL